jgi:phosphate-selective porin OprO/OprP
MCYSILKSGRFRTARREAAGFATRILSELSVKIFVSCILLSTAVWAQDPIEVHGYIQGRFTNQEGVPDRLEIRRARLLVFGDPFSELSYNTQVDVAKKPYLLDASLTWKPAGAFHVTIGQFKIPFSADSLLADNLEVPIERARAVNSLAPGRDTGVQSRDTGLQLSGILERRNRPWVEYAAGVFRGQTLIYSPAAHFRAIAARVMLHPIQGLTVGADRYESISVSGGPVKRRSEVEASYKWKSLTVQGEHIWARDAKLERDGGYALSAWRFDKQWEGMTRVEWLHSNTSKPNSGSFIYEAGANYYYGKHVKVQANVGARSDQFPSRTTGVVLTQVQLSF